MPLLLAVLALLAGCVGGPPSPQPPPAPPAAPPAPPTTAPAPGPSPWVETFGGPTTDHAWGIGPALNGDVFVATHQTVETALPNIYVYRLRPDGSTVWRVRRPAPFGDHAFVVTERAGVVYVGGFTNAFADARGIESADGLILALDGATGALRWATPIDGTGDGYEEIDGLVPTADGIYFSGWTTSAGTGKDVLLGRLGLDGSIAWVRPWGGPAWDEADGHLVLIGDRLYLSGRVDAAGFAFGGKALVAAFASADGAPVWSTTWGGGLFAFDYLSLATDGSLLYAVGIAPGPTGGQIVLHAYDLSGDEVWKTQWVGPSSASSRSVTVDPTDDSLFVVGRAQKPGSQEFDVQVLRFAAGDGALLSSCAWGGASPESSYDAVVDATGGYVVGETSSFGAGHADAFVLRFDRARPCTLPPPSPG
ncbi:MAG: hypothetical protein ACT4PI_00765 [Actinomycetota bacterium]